MGISLTFQSGTFLCAVLLGAALGLIFEIFRALDNVLRPDGRRTFAFDVIYFLFSAPITFFFLLIVNHGEMRSFIAVGEILGWVLFRATVGKIVSRPLKFFFKALIRLLGWLEKICTPVVLHLKLSARKLWHRAKPALKISKKRKRAAKTPSPGRRRTPQLQLRAASPRGPNGRVTPQKGKSAKK